jgi:hypothetical protein
MPTMLPATKPGAPRLADVLSGCLASIRGRPNRLGLPRARAAIVVLVDGLGAANIRARAGHARFLSSRLAKRDVIAGVFPSTTAAGIATMCTGRMPGEHGLVGYRVQDPTTGELSNQLTGWGTGAVEPSTWQRVRTVFELAGDEGIASWSVGPGRYADSGFTAAVLRGSRYVAQETLTDRFDAALRLASDPAPALVYLYIPELDIAAHAVGWESDRWLAHLEEVDAGLARLAQRMPADVGLLVTADHGVIDVPERRHVFIDRSPALVEGVRCTGGDPRCLYLYLDPELDESRRDDLVAGWRATEAERAWVLTREEAVTAGLFGAVDAEVLPRIGDIIVAARAGIAYYDDRQLDKGAQRMVGQHGSLTDEETRVPLVRTGRFSWGTGAA